MSFDPTIVFAGVLALAILLYVLLDGFDLGLGILFPGAPDEKSRDTMMNSVAPVWDGNETWLVLGGGGLLTGFPIAFGILMPAFYLPIIIMLLALIFRGVSFEFRFKATRNKHLWDKAFHYGSLTAAFMQGVILGAFIEGVAVEDFAYAGAAFDWLSPFSVFTGVAVVAGYALLGATWTIWRTEGELQAWAYRMAGWLTLAVLGCLAVVSLWTPLTQSAIAERWFSLPNFLYLAPIPVLTLAAAGALVLALRRRREVAPFLLAYAIFLCGYAGLGASIWPYAVPRSVTLDQAAAEPNSQVFVLIGLAVLLPIILGYTAYSYWVFRGKVDPDQGYH